MCKGFSIEWVNKVLLYSAENGIQCLLVNHNGKADHERVQGFPGRPGVQDAALPQQGLQIPSLWEELKS